MSKDILEDICLVEGLIDAIYKLGLINGYHRHSFSLYKILLVPFQQRIWTQNETTI